MPDQGRVLYAALQLLDRQMLDRTEYRCGNVDDLELDTLDDGTLVVTHILAGPGVLLERLGRARLGRWWRKATATDATNRIPMRAVIEIGADVSVAVDAKELATSNTERWARERVVAHIPGNDMGGQDQGEGE